MASSSIDAELIHPRPRGRELSSSTQGLLLTKARIHSARSRGKKVAEQILWSGSRPGMGKLQIQLRWSLTAMLGATVQTKRSPDSDDLSLQVSLVAGGRNRVWRQPSPSPPLSTWSPREFVLLAVIVATLRSLANRPDERQLVRFSGSGFVRISQSRWGRHRSYLV